MFAANSSSASEFKGASEELRKCITEVEAMCGGTYDDGVMPTRCTASGGCGKEGCPRPVTDGTFSLTPGPEKIRESDVGRTSLRMFGWTWNTRRILAEDVGKRVTMSSTEFRISIEGD